MLCSDCYRRCILDDLSAESYSSCHVYPPIAEEVCVDIAVYQRLREFFFSTGCVIGKARRRFWKTSNVELGKLAHANDRRVIHETETAIHADSLTLVG